MKAAILRFDAPLMSFGSVIVDHHGFTDLFPGKAMLTGLIGNALGYDHNDAERLAELQERLDFAARWDVEPAVMVDYHTVDLGSQKMRSPGWTTYGSPEHRAGGPAARYGIHQRYRHYLVDGLMTVALGLVAGGHPDLETIVQALNKPARPLFVGRKSCLPSRPLLDPWTPILEGTDLLSILARVPIWTREGQVLEEVRRVRTCWTPPSGEESAAATRLVYDLRDWHNQLPAGSRNRCEGLIEVGLR
ncbi:MAG TPA: type I-E CRISPR-associated protein Cas5/CasD [Limnochordia bacterium]|nr:type I-E CRISPR-associated protein Cas5/CasD [Limnochordia bacterium]